MIRKCLAIHRKAAFSDLRRRMQEERQSRLNPHLGSLPVNAVSKLNAFRNVCTIAHIDAGKTTLTERLLYGCGAIGDLGEVHDGTALMDFTEEERKRGITINSACITFMWKQIHINLIDTPGHADFNFEVERSLKILDGAMVIIDAVKGVEAQTKMVWGQANKYNVARLIIINKMDKMGADYQRAIENVENNLNTAVFPAFIPVFLGEDFSGIIDILDSQYYAWTKYPGGKTVPRLADEYSVSDSFYRTRLALNDFPENVQKDYFRYLERIVEILSQKDPEILEAYLSAVDNNNSVSQAFLQRVAQDVRKMMASFPSKYSLSLPTSALKNKGIHTALDSIIQYLPAPTAIMANSTLPLAFIFKRVLDPEHGILAFAKIICGKLQKQRALFNPNKNIEYPKGAKILRIRAAEYAEMDEATSGDIVALSGLKDFHGGDNLIEPNSLRSLEGFLVKGFENRDPVYHVSVEFRSTTDRERFMTIIDAYVLEDPSISFRLDKQTGQYVISGQGELHIETKLNRIFREHNLKVTPGRVAVTFKESAMGSHETSFTFSRKNKAGFRYLKLEISVESDVSEESEGQGAPKVEIGVFKGNRAAQNAFEEYLQTLKEIDEIRMAAAAMVKDDEQDTSAPKNSKRTKTSNEKLAENLKQAKLATINNPTEVFPLTTQHDYGDDLYDNIYDLSMMNFGMLAELQKALHDLTVKGPLSFSPLVDTKIVVTGGQFNPKFIDPIGIRMAASEAFTRCVKPEFFNLLEPLVEVQITCKSDAVNDIISDAVSQRKGRMGQILSGTPEETEFTVSIPLLTSLNYSSYLRSVTNGEVRMSMKNCGYIRTSNERKELLLKNYL